MTATPHRTPADWSPDSWRRFEARQLPTYRDADVLAEAERETAERRIRVERINARPNVSASVGVTRYEAEDATALTFGKLARQVGSAPYGADATPVLRKTCNSPLVVVTTKSSRASLLMRAKRAVHQCLLAMGSAIKLKFFLVVLT